jgi:anti-anti-sigma factor
MRSETPPTDDHPRCTSSTATRSREPLARVTVRPGSGHDVVVLSGEFDLSTAPQLSPVVHRLLGQGRRRIVLDLDAVTFLDGFAIDMLVMAHRDVRRAGGSLEITRNRLCERLLACTGTTTFLRP